MEMPRERYLVYRNAEIAEWLNQQTGPAKTLGGPEFSLLCLLDAMATWQWVVKGGAGEQRCVSVRSKELETRERICRSSVLRYREKLEQAGVIKVVARKTRGRATTPEIYITMPGLDAPAIRGPHVTAPGPSQPVAVDRNTTKAPRSGASSDVSSGDREGYRAEAGSGARTSTPERTVDYSTAISSDVDLRKSEDAVIQLLPSAAPPETAARAQQIISANRQLLSRPCDQLPSYWGIAKGLPPDYTSPNSPLWSAIRRLTIVASVARDRVQLGHRAIQGNGGAGRDEVHELSHTQAMHLQRWTAKHYARAPERKDIIKEAAWSVTVGTMRQRPLAAALATIRALREKGKWRTPIGYAPEHVCLGETITVTLPSNHQWKSGARAPAQKHETYSACVHAGAQ